MSLVLFAALVWQVIDFLRELANLRTQKSSVVTQLCAWVGGIIVVAIFCNASLTEGVVPPGVELAFGQFGFGDVILYGLLASSVASSSVDIKQAIDSKDSAAKPPLLT